MTSKGSPVTVSVVEKYWMLRLGFQEKQRSDKATHEGDQPSTSAASVQGTS